MTSQNRTTLKGYFETGDRPTQTQFENLIDSFGRESTKGNALVGHENDTSSGSPGVVVMAQLSSSAVNPSLPSDTGGVFSKSVSGTAEVFTIDEAGNVTQQTPHSFSLFEPPDEYAYPWVYRWENAYLGAMVEVDMWGAIREIERISGKKFIHIGEVDKIEWQSHKPMPNWMVKRLTPRLPHAPVALTRWQRLSKWCKRLPKWIHKTWMDWILE